MLSLGCWRGLMPVKEGARRIVHRQMSENIIHSTQQSAGAFGRSFPECLSAQMQLHHRLRIQRRMEESGNFSPTPHSLQGVRHLIEESRVGSPVPELLDLSQNVAI